MCPASPAEKAPGGFTNAPGDKIGLHDHRAAVILLFTYADCQIGLEPQRNRRKDRAVCLQLLPSDERCRKRLPTLKRGDDGKND